MYCSGCGTVINPGQGFCPQCGRAAAAPVPPVPTMAFEVEQYGIKIQTLGTMWILYAGLVLLTWLRLNCCCLLLIWAACLWPSA